MKNRFGLICAAGIMMMALSAPVFAQGGGGQGPGGRRGGFRGGGRGGMMASPAMVPVNVLSYELKLTSDQKTKIQGIQDKLRSDMQAMRPQQGAPPDPSVFQKFQERSQQATQDVEAVLNDNQKKMLPDVIKELRALSMARVPLEVVPDLKLTHDQKKTILAVATDTQNKMQAAMQSQDREQFRTIMQDSQQKVMAALTSDQKSIIDKYNQAHPRRGFGGQGGFGGGRRQGQNT